MDISLDDLLQEVEGAMSTPRKSGSSAGLTAPQQESARWRAGAPLGTACSSLLQSQCSAHGGLNGTREAVDVTRITAGAAARSSSLASAGGRMVGWGGHVAEATAVSTVPTTTWCSASDAASRNDRASILSSEPLAAHSTRASQQVISDAKENCQGPPTAREDSCGPHCQCSAGGAPLNPFTASTHHSTTPPQSTALVNNANDMVLSSVPAMCSMNTDLDIDALTAELALSPLDGRGVQNSRSLSPGSGSYSTNFAASRELGPPFQHLQSLPCFTQNVTSLLSASVASSLTASQHAPPTVWPQQQTTSSGGIRSITLPTSGAKKRCSTVFLGGASCRFGCCSSSAVKCACENLRCTGCDFSVLMFPSRAWADDVHYMFFRNNMPDKDKLASQLVDAPDSAAYSCQCSWRTVMEYVKVVPAGELRWVCGGHQV